MSPCHPAIDQCLQPPPIPPRHSLTASRHNRTQGCVALSLLPGCREALSTERQPPFLSPAGHVPSLPCSAAPHSGHGDPACPCGAESTALRQTSPFLLSGHGLSACPMIPLASAELRAVRPPWGTELLYASVDQSPVSPDGLSPCPAPGPSPSSAPPPALPPSVSCLNM